MWPWKESNNKNPQIVLRIILERTENDYETESPGNNKKLWIVVTNSVTYSISTQEHGGDVMTTTYWNLVDFQIIYILNNPIILPQIMIIEKW